MTENKNKNLQSVKKEKKPTRLRMGHYLFIMAIVVLFIIITLTGGISAIIQWAKTNPIKLSDVILVLIAGAVVGIVVYFVMSKRIVKSVSRLADAMTKVSKGDFNVQIETHSKIEEINKSYESFNIMVKELRSTETLQTDFVSNVSHEFKTPINAIEGYATLLQGDDGISDEQREYIEKILLNTGRLSELIGGILLLSKIENQIIAPKNEDFRLDEQIRRAIVFLEPKWSKKNIEFDVIMDDVVFWGSSSLLAHVWLNLIDNAIKFSPNGSVITVILKKNEKDVTFIIKDNGIGISESAKKHIFDKFYQADVSHSHEGNGLGLALVKRIVNVSYGSIEVSDNDGDGTVFTVILPIIDKNAPGDDEKSLTYSAKKNRKK